MEVDKICRTCLALSGPFLTIYNDATGSAGCIANMLEDFTNLKVIRSEKLPEKVCLTCISEINRCYSFKIKCENSLRTLLQLLPDAALNIEDFDNRHGGGNIEKYSIGVQTESIENEDSSTAEKKLVVAPAPHQQVKADNELVDGRIIATFYDQEDDYMKTMQQNESKEKHNLSASHIKVEPPKKRKCIEEFIDNAAAYHQNDEILIQRPADTEETFIEIAESTVDYDDNARCDEDDDEDNSNDEYNQLVYAAQTDETAAAVPAEDENNYNFTIYNNENGETEVIAKRLRAARSKSNAPQKAQLKCSECLMTFVSEKNLRRHVAKRHDDWDNRQQQKQQKQPPAEQAQETAEDAEELQMNEDVAATTATADMNNVQLMASVTSKLNFFCERCKAGFALRKSLNYHRKQSACTAKSYKCNECERVFISEKALEEHKTMHLGHICTECNKEFDTKENLSAHLIAEHKRSIRNQCDICKKVFTMLSALRDHLRTHSGEKPYLCTYCGKAFSQNANLKQHIMRHSNLKNFQCDVCDNSFVTKAELYSHKRTHTGDQPFKCEFCNAQFTTSSSLVKHKRKHTGERPYACDICPMRFAALNVLKNHRRTHTGEKPYKCSFCQKGFTQKGDCQIHQRTHTGERRYVCNCGEKFAHLAKLRAHAKTHANESKTKTQYATVVDSADELDDNNDVITINSQQSHNNSLDEELMHIAIEEEEEEDSIC